MTGHRSSTLSSCRGHGRPAQHYFRRLCPEIWLGIGSPQFAHAVDNSPQVHGILWSPTSEELLSHLGHCWAKPAGAAPKGVIAPILRNGLPCPARDSNPSPFIPGENIYEEPARGKRPSLVQRLCRKWRHQLSRWPEYSINGLWINTKIGCQ